MGRTKGTMYRSCFGSLCESEPEKLIGKVKSNSDVHSQAVQTPFFFSDNKNKLKSFETTDTILNSFFITHWKLNFVFIEAKAS